MSREDTLGRSLAGTIGVGIALGAAVGGVFAAGKGPRAFAISWGISTLYSINIGVPASLGFRWLRRRIGGKPVLQQWLAYVGILLGVSAAGTAVTGLILMALGLVRLDELWDTYLGAFKIAMLIALPMTAGAVSYSRMHVRLAELSRARERAESLAAEARLASLESRVRPHFLFNALNSAIALIPENPARAEKLLERLAALLRFSLDAHRDRLVPLGEELRVVADYLEIERVRFGDRLRYELDVPGELAAVAIPAFSIQTLVENGVKYAVSARASGAAIVVRVRSGEGRLAIEVRDDGPGFTGEVWQPGHGLDGLRARLDALYGPRARLVAPAAADRGAAVTVELPIAEAA